ncbi:MAG: leucine-rich repeat domain-containing protein [Solobacterium sp.]|nr:leucine-rich repeat domain-containing protein [Solobacterium sp.]
MRASILKTAGILTVILLVILAVYNPRLPQAAAEVIPLDYPVYVEEAVTEVALTEENWLDYFTVDCREQLNVCAGCEDISPIIHLEYRLTPRREYIDRLVCDGSELHFVVRYHENFGIFPVDVEGGHILDDSSYSTASPKAIQVTLILTSGNCTDGTLIVSTDVICTDIDSGIGQVCTSFEIAAAEGLFQIQGTNLSANQAEDTEIVAQGITGSVRWKLDEDGLLTVFGEGKMATGSSIPWKDYLNDIRRVVIDDGVCNICRDAFRHAQNLEEVSIGNTVSVISDSAFYDCPKLQHICIPASVQAIGEQAFAADGMLGSVEVDPDNLYYASTGRTIYDKNLTTLVCCVGNVPTFRIPEGVTSIGPCAFRGHSRLYQVELPNSLVSIAESAFRDCDNLKDVFFRGTLEEWENISVGSCNDALASAKLICREVGDRPARSEMNTLLDDGELTVQYKGQSLLVELSGIEVADTYLLDRTGSMAGLSEYVWTIGFSDGLHAYQMSTAYFTKNPGMNRTGSLDDMKHDFLVETSECAFRSLAEADVQHTDNSICWRVELPETCSIDYDSIDSFNVEIRDFVGHRHMEKRHYLPADLTGAEGKAVGRTLYMGCYEQDNLASDGAEPIEWVVLAVEKDQALLMSHYGLDCIPYQEHWESEIHWSSCDLRSWLNEDFCLSAFSEEERKVILPVLQANTDDPRGDRVTEDRVFLLSLSEAAQYVEGKEYAICQPSDYAIGRGADDILREEYWWLRTPGSGNRNGSIVDILGKPTKNGFTCTSESVCVRPCFWLDLSAA